MFRISLNRFHVAPPQEFPGRRVLLQRLYREFQLLVAESNDVLSIWIVIAYFGSLILVISHFFVAIRLNVELGILTLVIMLTADLAIFVISALLQQFALSFSIYSNNYLRLAQRNLNTKLEGKFFRSCQPIRISVGGLFAIESRDFLLRTLVTVVFETTINLLITFRKWIRNDRFNIKIPRVLSKIPLAVEPCMRIRFVWLAQGIVIQNPGCFKSQPKW